jgi:hypothetical protein
MGLQRRVVGGCRDGYSGGRVGLMGMGIAEVAGGEGWRGTGAEKTGGGGAGA